MSLTRLAFTLAFAGLAAKLYMSLRRTGVPAARGASTAPARTPDEGRIASAGTGSAPRQPTPSTADSPNDAERLQARGIARTDATDDTLFGSNSQHGAEPQAPGLPDFARGA